MQYFTIINNYFGSCVKNNFNKNVLIAYEYVFTYCDRVPGTYSPLSEYGCHNVKPAVVMT